MLDPATPLMGVCLSKFNEVDSCICLKFTASTPFEAVGTICA